MEVRQGLGCSAYKVQASANLGLGQWLPVHTDAANSALDFRDAQFPNHARHFYRVVPWP